MKKGILYRMNHSNQVERAFGVLKNDYGFQRFLLHRYYLENVLFSIKFYGHLEYMRYKFIKIVFSID